MCARRSKMFQKSTTSSPLSTRLAFYTVALLLLSFAAERATSMSLERLGVDQNELNSANNQETKTVNDADIVVDDMELEAVPTSGNTDTYLLVPGGGANERESVEKNIIENVGDSNGPAEEVQANEASDMLMVESNDAPLHMSFLAVPVEQTELVVDEEVAKQDENSEQDVDTVHDDEPQISSDKIMEIPNEPQEMLPVSIAEVSNESIDKLGDAQLSDGAALPNIETVSAEHETIADVIAEAVQEVEKDMEDMQSADETLNNEDMPVQTSEIVEDKKPVIVDQEEGEIVQDPDEKSEAMESLSAMEADLMPQFVADTVETADIQLENGEKNIEPSPLSDSTVENVNVEENEIRDVLKGESLENNIAEEFSNKPEDTNVNVEAAEDHQPENVVLDAHNEESEIAAELPGVVDNASPLEITENHIEGNKQTNMESEPEEINPMAEAIEKEIEADIVDMITEESKVDETVAQELTQPEDVESFTPVKQAEDDKQILSDNQTEVEPQQQMETAEENQHAGENEVVEVAKEDQTNEETKASIESQTPEQSQTFESSLDSSEIHALEESQASASQILEESQISEDIEAPEETQAAEESQAPEVGQDPEEHEASQESHVSEITQIQDESSLPEEVADKKQLIVEDQTAEEAQIVEDNKQPAVAEESNAAEETNYQSDESKPEVAIAAESQHEDTAAEDVKETIPTSEDSKQEENINQDKPIIDETQPAETLPEEIGEEQVAQQHETEMNSQQLETVQQVANSEELLHESDVNQADIMESVIQSDSQQSVEENSDAVAKPEETEGELELQEVIKEKLEEAKVEPESEQFVETQVPQLQEQVETVEEMHETQAQELQQPQQESEASEQVVEHLEENVPLVQEEEEDELKNEEGIQQEQSLIQQQQQSAEELSQPEAELSQPEKEQSQPEAEQSQPETEQSQQETEYSQPEMEQSQPETELPHPESEQQLPQQILADEPAETPTEIVTESLSNEPIQPINSLLTTIIQAPNQQQQQPTPIKIEDDEAPLTATQMATLVSVNNPPETVVDPSSAPAPAHTPVPAPAPAPLNVMDSVLNYVNASFMQHNNIQQTTQNLKDDDSDDDDLNAQLRRYDGAQVWRIVVQNDHDKKMADELQTKYGGQLWKEVKQEVDYLLKPQVLSEAAQHVRAANLSRIVLIDNLQNVIETENPSAAEIALYQNRKGHRLTWKAYHRLADIHGFFDTMAKTYPDICSVETIGYSLQKRPLKILKISNGNPGNPGIWMDGGMHAREWISPATVTFIANQLIEDWEILPEYMRNVDWYIHAVANPDGYEYTHTTDRLWRKNMRSHGRQCPGVDLNRNFGYKWGGKGTSANPCSQTYRGSKAFSEPETFYISKYISNHPRDTFQAYLSFHSYGQYILYPWGYDYHLTADKMDLDRVARQAGTTITKKSGGKYTVGSSATTLYPAAGGSDDWAKGFAGIKYAYTIEMGDTGRYGFVLPASHIESNGRDGYTFVDTVARAVTQGNNKYSRKRAF
ncbi:uncharacterized protein LOC101461300 isoform X2 [Ceratitis capitata]|uniref:uncharacterized protein LOC101461300 isoform X2 n=1 Tax=Ceratitis capitata TaxID=7213 RepID=UPI0006187F4B|nr:uncharacterized protein LOC101461300 isoform X2 [Ceratitis capitata]